MTPLCSRCKPFLWTVRLGKYQTSTDEDERTPVNIDITPTAGLIIVAVLSGLVALANGLIPAYLDSKRAERERVAAEQERIREAAAKLLRNLANFRNLGQDDQKLAAGLPSHQQVTAEMRGAYDAWALVVMTRLNASQQERVKEIRKEELGRGNLKQTEAQDDISMSTEIFELTWIAIGNVR